MYTDVLRSITGIEVFPVLSLVIFVTFFAVVLLRVRRMDARRLQHLSLLPLDGHEAGHAAPPDRPEER